MTLPEIKPSPVHETSLRQALQRVEDRLRQQDEQRSRDARHERTLKLARELAVEGVRRRQRDWERQHRKNAGGPRAALPAADAGAARESDLKQTPHPEAAMPLAAHLPRRGLTRLMPVVAWLILSAGLIGAVLSWTTISDVQAGSFQVDAARSGMLPLGLLLGFAYLATGVLGFAFFWVSSLISNQLKDIRRLLFLQPMMSDRTGIGTESERR